MKRLFFLLLIPSLLVAGTNRHVKLTGGVTSGPALDSATAWTLNWSFSASNVALQPGDTVWFHNGNYICDKDNGDIPRRAGNASFPIIYRAMPGQHVVLYSNRTPPWAPLQIEAPYTWFWGFELYQTDVVTGQRADLIIINADYVKIINCVVRDGMGIGITDYSNVGTEVTGCIVYYNGRQTQICQHAYAGYIQNKSPSPRKLYRFNDIFSNWDAGQQFYGSDATEMDNISIDSCRFWNNGNLQGKLGGEQFQPNVLIGAGESTAKVVTGITFRGNLGYYSASPGGGNYFSMGYHGNGISGWIVTGNIMVSRGQAGFNFPEGYGGSTIANNIVVGPTQSVVTGNPGQGNVGYADFAAAAAARSDDVIIYKNPYEKKRASITIFNWDGSATVSFDPSSVLQSGDVYQVRSATNFWNNVLASGTWTSGNITITCANITMSTPLGYPGVEPANGCGQTGASFNLPVNPQPYFIPLVLVGPYSQDTTVAQPPPVPLATAGSSITNTSFSANWQASSGATSYRLDVSTSSGFGSFVSGFNDLNVGNVTTKSVTGLSASTTYYYRVRAVGAGGTSASSNVITVVTSAPPQPPAAPVATAATNITPASFVAHWNSSASATGYFIDVSLAANFASMVAGYNNLSVGNNLSVSVSGLAEQTTYYYRVRASNANGTSGNSNTINLTTTAQPPAVPNPPVAIAADSVSQTSFRARWNASSGATEYRLDVSTSPGFGSFVIGYNNLNMGSGLTKQVTGLSASTTYYYRVRASNVSGTSGNSNVITAQTNAIPLSPPSAPDSAAATSVTYSSFVANWDTSATATGYQIDVSTDSLFGTFVAGYNNLVVYDTLVSVTGLSASTRYHYRVRAFNTAGVSANSAIVNVNTSAEPPSLPTVPLATAASSLTDSSFSANWSASTGALSYRLDVSLLASFATFVGSFNDLNVGDVVTRSVTGLSPLTTYYYRLRAVNGAGTTSSSNVITVTTPDTQIVAPVAPVTLTATGITNWAFTAHWTPVSNADSYRLDVSVADTFDTFLPGYQDLNVGNVFQLQVSGLSELRTYYYRVRAVNPAGVSDESNVTSVTTLATSNARRRILIKH